MLEYKTNPIETCELKFDDDEWKVEGYASVFNSVDSYGDTILPGAFQKSLESGVEIKMYYEHSRIMKPGKWAVFEEDKYGLKSAGHLTRDHSLAKDIRAELRHGTITGLSIGFTIPYGGAEEKEDGGRIIKAVDLVEVSLTGSPAEPKAVITSFKSALEEVQNIREFEKFLRDSMNLSRGMATALISHAKALCQSDSEQETAERLRELKAVMDRYDIRNLIA